MMSGFVSTTTKTPAAVQYDAYAAEPFTHGPTIDVDRLQHDSDDAIQRPQQHLNEYFSTTFFPELPQRHPLAASTASIDDLPDARR